MGGAPETSPLSSVDRALRILELLSEYGAEGQALGVIGEQLGEDKVSVHRSLAALKFRNMVQQNPENGIYSIGTALLALTNEFLRTGGLYPVLHRVAVAVSAKARELCHVAVMEGRTVRYIDKVEPDLAIRVFSRVGVIFPNSITALGRAMLSVECRSFDELALMVDPTTIDPHILWPKIQLAAQRGFAIEREENESGISCVSIPVIHGGRAAAAVSISAPASRMTDTRIEELASLIHRELEAQLPEGLSVRPLGTSTPTAG